MNALLVVTALFAVGLLQDALAALYIRLAANNNIFWASVISVLITLISCSAWVIMADTLISGGIHNLIAYAIGGGVGTYIGLGKKTKT
jgi:uncharacterized protein YebE (UPF0316 family)